MTAPGQATSTDNGKPSAAGDPGRRGSGWETPAPTEVRKTEHRPTLHDLPDLSHQHEGGAEVPGQHRQTPPDD
ncbi:hypothetical protein JCM33774_89320 [Actinophytocola sp. KF-1]